MRRCVTSLLLSLAVFGVTMFIPDDAAAQCRHLGRLVECPPFVPPGSGSAFFGPGGEVNFNTPGGLVAVPGKDCCRPFDSGAQSGPTAGSIEISYYDPSGTLFGKGGLEIILPEPDRATLDNYYRLVSRDFLDLWDPPEPPLPGLENR